jgi:hypothetical protein
MYYSEWIANFEKIRLGFIIHDTPLNYMSESGSHSGFFIEIKSQQVNKRIRPKIKILKISGGKYFKLLYNEPGFNGFVKFLTVNQKFTDEEELRIKSGIEIGEICIGKQRE